MLGLDARATRSLTYGRALRCSWRLTWPVGVAAFFADYPAELAMRYGFLPNPLTTPYVFAGFIVVNALTTFLILPNLVNRRYRGFSLAMSHEGIACTGMPLVYRRQVWLWLVTRDSLACCAAVFLLAPLRIVLSLVGIHVGVILEAGVYILGVRPLVVWLLVEHYFVDFKFDLLTTP
jgi:hypothetical protein